MRESVGQTMSHQVAVHADASVRTVHNVEEFLVLVRSIRLDIRPIALCVHPLREMWNA